MELDMYLFFLREAVLHEYMKTQEGRDYLNDCYRLEQTQPDRTKMKETFKERR